MGVLNASVVASVLNSSSINSLVSNAQSAGILNAATSNLISNSLNGQIVSSFPLPQCSLSNNQNQNNQNSQNNQNFPGATTARPNFGSYDPNYLFLTQTYLGNSQNATLIAATISQISVDNDSNFVFFNDLKFFVINRQSCLISMAKLQHIGVVIANWLVLITQLLPKQLSILL